MLNLLQHSLVLPTRDTPFGASHALSSLVAIERASGSESEICLSSLFIISKLIALSRTISSLSFSILPLQPFNFRLRHRIAMSIGGFKLREALIDPLKTSPHLGLGEVLVPCIDSLELWSVNGDARCTEQIKLAAQRNELATDLSNGLAIVLRKSAMVLKSGASCPVSQISSMLRWHSLSRRRLDGTRLR
jgi:hypothetical protein